MLEFENKKSKKVEIRIVARSSELVLVYIISSKKVIKHKLVSGSLIGFLV